MHADSDPTPSPKLVTEAMPTASPPSPTSTSTSFSTLKGSFTFPPQSPPHDADHDHFTTPTKASSTTTVNIPTFRLPPTPARTPTECSKRHPGADIAVETPLSKRTKRAFSQDPESASESQPTPTKCPKRPSTSAIEPKTPSTKKIQSRDVPTTTPFRRTLFKRNDSTPKFSIAYKPPPSPSAKTRPSRATSSHKPATHISALEWERVAESVLRQVDWEEVARDVAGNRGAGVYRRGLRGLFVGMMGEGMGEWVG